MTWVWGSSMGQKQGDHAAERAGTNISGGVRLGRYSRLYIPPRKAPIRREKGEGAPRGAKKDVIGDGDVGCCQSLPSRSIKSALGIVS